ncbi:hypothetical protein [Pectobacterium sp. 21LCBS03]|uniref:hypothetical protein n=1 Tax=unclassified Pectobacterium TaxID=2627739 RepID=UPI002010645C|nr:hypothetical protein [Pectobacterium sp. 21LCBS03]UPY93896.1 hypothetical protein MYB54_14985 [Pectobacterium sp. 21LCBS03]
MDWQGIPYKILNDTADSVNLAVTALPRIVFDSQPDYTSPIITGVVSVVAGLIPALIAFYTFKRNAVILKSEREAQQLFLRSERAEQQRFLENERAAHIASTEKDRETQLAIAKKNFDMQVLSVNRQEWINRLRDLLAEYMTLAPNLLTVKHNLLVRSDAMKKASELRKENPHFNNDDRFRADFNSISSDLSKGTEQFVECRQKEKLLTSKIKLMINSNEKWYAEILKCFDEVKEIYFSLDGFEEDEYIKKTEAMIEVIDKLLKSSQSLLKYEWDRVKKGV